MQDSYRSSSPTVALSTFTEGFPLASAVALLIVLSVPKAWAGPEGGVVVHGGATITEPAPGQTNVNQSTERAIIDWRSFSVAPHESVNFLQPSTASITLNRVTGGQRSIIEGALNANGHIFLLNSSGILFGRDARIDVGGLLATTANIANDDFLAGRFDFSGAPAGSSVENFGRISIRDGGFAALVAPTVRNSGHIVARMGRVSLAGADTYTVDLFGDQLINFALPGGRSTASAESSSGLIADGGRLAMHTGSVSSVLDSVVNVSAFDPAVGISFDRSGDIILRSGQVTHDGVIDVSGSTGGKVDLFAGSIQLGATSLIDASGSAGGGRVRIGGDAAGAGGPRATQVDIASGARILADATTNGNGGRVTVWGEELADFQGSISVRGGADGGDGGFVEVSSADVIRFLGDVFLDAPKGKGGLLFLDPDDVVILPIGSSSLNASVIDANALNRILRSGGDVVLTATNSIRVDELVDGRGGAVGGDIRLTAGTIVLSRPLITNDGAIHLRASSGSVTFTSDAYLYVSGSGAGSVGNAEINVRAAQNVLDEQSRSVGALISLGSVTVTADAGRVQLLNALAGLQNSGIGTLTVRAAGDIALRGVRSTGVVDARVTGASGRVSIEGAPVLGTSVWLEAGSGGLTIGAAGSNAQSSAITATSGDVVLLSNGGAATINQSVLAQSGNICVGAGANDACVATPAATAVRTGPVTMASGAALQASTGTSSSGISIFSAGSVQAQDLLVGTGGRVQIDATGAVTMNRAIAGFNSTQGVGQGINELILISGGAVTLAGVTSLGSTTVSGSSISTGPSPIRAGGNVSLTSTGAGGITVGSAGETAIQTTGTGTVSLTSQSGGAARINGSLLTAGGNISVTGNAGITMGAGTALQAYQVGGGQAGGIALTANGAIDARSLIAGPMGSISITTTGTSGTVDLREAMTGLTGGPAAQFGSLTITASRDISIAGARTSGDITLNTPRNVTIGGALDAGGALQIGNTTAVNSIAVGSSLPTVRGSSINIRAVESAGTAPEVGDVRREVPSTVTQGAVWLGGVDSGGAVTIRGADVTLLGNLGTFDPMGSGAQGAGRVEIFGSRTVDLRAVTGGSPTADGMQLLTGDGGKISLRGQVVSYGDLTIGLASIPTSDQGADINLSHNIATAGRSVTFNGDVTLFDGIDRFAVERARRCQLGAAADCSDANRMAMRNDPYFDVGLFVVAPTLGLETTFYDSLVPYASGTTPSQEFEAFWVGDVSDSFESRRAYRAVLGSLVAGINTSLNSGTPALIQVNGSIGRFIPTALPAGIQPFRPANPFNGNEFSSGVGTSQNGRSPSGTADDPAGSVVPVFSSFIHHTLDLTGSGALIATGRVGDNESGARRTLALGLGGAEYRDTPTGADSGCLPLGDTSCQNTENFIAGNIRQRPDNSIGGSAYVPLVQQSPTLGRFVVIGQGVSVSASATVGGYVYFGGDAAPPTFNGNVTAVQFDYQTDNGDPGDNGVRPGDRTGLASRSPAPIGLTGGPGVSGGQGPAGSSGRDPNAPTGGVRPAGSGTNVDVASAASAEDRRASDDAADETDDAGENSLCPRGAAADADLGTRRATDGATPDVFSRCEEFRSNES
jgi:trimeric autotransporter adhesin